MKRMWQKYTPAKRVLALLLAVLMICDTFTVSAATSEGEVSTEVESEVVEVTDEVTEPEENLVEEEEPAEEEPVVTDEPTVDEPEADEPVVEVVPDSETTENGDELETTTETELILEENEVEQLTSGSFTTADVISATLEGNILDENAVVRVNGEISEWVYVWLGTSTLIEDGVVKPILSDGVTQVEGSFLNSNSWESNGVWQYEVGYSFELSGYENFEPTTLTIVNVADETDIKTYEFFFDALYQTDSDGNTTIAGRGSSYEVGDVYELSTKCVEDGIFGYVTVVSTDASVSISAENMSDAAKSEWNSFYKNTYGTYGTNGKYYFFTYGDEVYGPTMKVNSTSAANVYYYYRNGEGKNDFEKLQSVYVWADDYHLKLNGSRIYKDDKRVNYIKYGTDDLVLDMYNGTKAYTYPVSLYEYDSCLEGAISITENSAGGVSVVIDADQVKNGDGATVGLAGLGDEVLRFTLYIEWENAYHSYALYPNSLAFRETTEMESNYVQNGETIEVALNDAMEVTLPEYFMLDASEITNVKLTSSAPAVVTVHGEMWFEELENGYSQKACWLECKKTGTAKLTASYDYKGVTYSKTVTVKVVLGASQPGFGYVDENYELIPFENNETIDIELGEGMKLFTTVSPRALSNITVKFSDTSLMSAYGSVSETFYYQDMGNHSVGGYRVNYINLMANSHTTGTVTATLSAKYNGKVYTQKVTFNITEPKGLQLKYAYEDWDGSWYADVQRVPTVMVDNVGSQRTFALYDDDAEGITGPADKDNYTFQIMKNVGTFDEPRYEETTDYELVWLNEYLFRIIPKMDDLNVNIDGIFRIIPNETPDAYVDLRFQYSTYNLLYASYDGEGKVSDPVSELYFVEGEESVFYTKLPKTYGSNYAFYAVNGIDLVSATIEYTDDNTKQIIVKFVVKNNGSVVTDQQMFGRIQATDNNWYVTEFNYRLLTATEATAEVATQAQISAFLNAADDSCDGEYRIGDYVVSLVTDPSAGKCAILTGYVGMEEDLFLPESFEQYYTIDIGTEAEHAISDFITVPIIGLDDGVFDTTKGYTQPKEVSIYAGYTYLGTDYSGWVNPDSKLRTSYDLWCIDDEDETMIFEIINDMVFTKVAGNYVCVDTGNANFAAVVPDGAVLYKNRTTGRTAIGVVAANAVSYYTLAKSYLFAVDEEGSVTELPILVTLEDGQYFLSVDETHENAAMVPDLESGVYYMSLTPVMEVSGQEVALAAQKCQIAISFENVAPVVKAQSSITLNTYLKTDSMVCLDIANSFETAITGVTITDAENVKAKTGLYVNQNGDGDWLLLWDGVTAIPKNTKIELNYEVEGFTADETSKIAPQTITVNGKSTKTQAKLSATTLTFNTYPYSEQSVQMTLTNTPPANAINVEETTIVAASVPKGVSKDAVGAHVNVTVDASKRVTVDVHNNATPGTYKFTITPMTQGDHGTYAATPVTLTVNVKGTKPAVKFAKTATVTLNSNFYNVTETLPELVYTTAIAGQVSQGAMHNPDNGVDVTAVVKSMPKNADPALVKLTPYFAGVTANEAEQKVYDLSEITFVASVVSGATAGSYVYTIEVPAIVDGDVVWMTTTATVKVVNTLPTFKLSGTTVTLDAAYPYDNDQNELNYSSGEVRLLMEEGYTLNGFNYIAPNVNAKETIAVMYDDNGTIRFAVENPGLSTGGTYQIMPEVTAPSGEELTLKTIKITVKVTNSSKATLSAKTKAMTVNPYIGGATITPNFTTKGVTVTPESTVTYVFEPTNGYSQLYGGDLAVVDGKVVASGWEYAIDGKYTYNVVQKVVDTDGTATYTKPLAFTVTVKKAALTVVPKASTLTTYMELGHVMFIDGEPYHMVMTPVSIKEVPEDSLANYVSSYASNNMESKGVITTFSADEEGTVYLTIAFPTELSKLSKLSVTPQVAVGSKAFKAFTMNVNVKNAIPATKFETATVTLDRYTTTSVENKLAGTEAYEICGINEESITIVKKGDKKKTDVSYMFDIEVYDVETATEDPTMDIDSIKISVKDEYIDTIPNATYIVTVNPYAAFAYTEIEIDEETGQSTVVEDGMYYDMINACSFNLNITQPKLALSVSEKVVNLYPDQEELVSDTVSVTAMDGTTPIAVSKIEVVPPTKSVVTEAKLSENGTTVTFNAKEIDGAYKSGSNVYNIKVYVKNHSGTADVLVGTISKAVTVNVKALPTKIALTSNKLTFSPYLEQSVELAVKDAELAALMETGLYSYDITVDEKTNKYKDLAADKKNDILTFATTPSGTITITDAKLPEKNATYYYTATIKLLKDGVEQKAYPVNFQVAVKNTKPVAALQKTSATLNNAYLDQLEVNKVTLSTGKNMWSLTDYANWDVAFKTSKNVDVTEKGYFECVFDPNGTSAFAVALNNADAEDKVFSVPVNTYKVVIIPKATDGNQVVELAPVTLTVKVVSNRPTAKFAATKLTVNTYTNAASQTKLTLTNGAVIVPEESHISCTKFPNKNITSADGIHVTLAADGTLTAYADRTAKAGTYVFTVTPVTEIDGYYVAVDAKTISIVVQNTMPTAVLSSSKVTLNSLFSDDYNATINVTAKNAGDYEYVFTKDAIVFPTTKSTKQSVIDNANILLENMVVTMNQDGTASITVNLPTDKVVANGTYKFTLTPSIMSGNEMEEGDAYALKAVSFSVVVENKAPVLSAKVSGSVDLVNQLKNSATVQLSFNKQNYETIDNIEDIRLLDKSTGENSWYFYIKSYDAETGKLQISNYMSYMQAGKSFALQLEVTSSTGRVYVVNITVKTAQANYKITASEANFYTAINSGTIKLDATEGVNVRSVEVLKVSTDSAGKKVISGVEFDGRVSQNGKVEIWSNGDLPNTIKSGTKIYVKLEVTPSGLASNKKPTTITVPVTVK